MPRALILFEPPAAPEPLRMGLLGLGYNVADELDDASRLLRRASAIEPDLILVTTAAPSAALFAATTALDQHAPAPVLVYAQNADAAVIERTIRSGVHTCVADGFSARRLPGLIAETRARFKLMRELTAQLHDVDEAVLLSDRIVMLTNGPAATIGEILAVPLARPRERLALAHDAQYIDCRSAVLEFLYQKQRKQAA